MKFELIDTYYSGNILALKKWVPIELANWQICLWLCHLLSVLFGGVVYFNLSEPWYHHP